jgi:RNA-directed DNA polymerase
MDETETPSVVTSGSEDWGQIPWRKLEAHVYHLQKRIYQAQVQGNTGKVRSLQRLLVKSRAAHTLAVRRVTQDNRGKKTAGIDGVKSVSPVRRLTMVDLLRNHAAIKARPVRRVYIPKPGKNEQRPLGIPVMLDRAHQALVKLALEPQWEARFEPNSYGFRPGRSAHDAIEAIFQDICIKDKYVLDADIKGCFDGIDHLALVAKLDSPPAMRRAIKAWLKAGVMEGLEYSPTTSGTPQGGVISPLLANIALHGMEQVAYEAYKGKDSTGRNRVRPTLIRYADDFVVLCAHEEGILAVQRAIEEWLGKIGLHLHPSKTRVTHTLHPKEGQAGFDFLGFHVRQYAVGRTHSGKSPQGRTLGFKTIIKPSKESVKRHIAELGKIVHDHKSVPQAVLIQHLNPVVRGWANYYRTVVAKVTLDQCDHHLYSQLRRWALRRHPRKPRRWVAQRYWRMQPGSKWEFEAKQNGKVIARLLTHRKTPIKRHVKVKGPASPFDGNLVYWSQRLKEHPLLAREEGKLLQRQQGRCMRCGRLFMEKDVREMDHIVPRAVGGSNLLLNKQLLHGHCHDQKHGQQASGCS